jgi:hypothetical protein
MNVLSFSDFLKLNSLNEGFQSGKLRAIIKQHGLPKYEWDKPLLYDIHDDDIIDVVKDFHEYCEKYDNGDDKNPATFCIDLQDGYRVVIGNMEIFSVWWKDNGEEVKKLIQKRNKRHIGQDKDHHMDRYRGKSNKEIHNYDDIHKKHQEKRDVIEHRRFVEWMKKTLTEDDIQELYNIIENHLNFDFEYREDMDETTEFEDEIELSVGNCLINSEYDVWTSGSRRSYGEYWCDGEIRFSKLTIYCDNDDLEMYGEVTDEEIGLDFKDIKTTYSEDDLECGVADYYEMYGVRPEDFV